MEVDIQTPAKENGQPKADEELTSKLVDVPETNGTEDKSKTPEVVTPSKRQTRSRSRTPQKKKQTKKSLQKELDKKLEEELSVEADSTNGEHKEIVKEAEEKIETESKESLNGNIEEDLKEKDDEKDSEAKKSDGEEMEPLVLNADDADPELDFEENSDVDSGKNSPVIRSVRVSERIRCRTRRSQTRNIPTPKTPKPSDNDQDSDKNSLAPTPDLIVELDSPLKSTPKIDFDHTYDSIDLNVSNRAVVGSDATRLEFKMDESMGESYLQSCRNRSIRGLSARKTIRPMHEDFLKKALKNNQGKADLNAPAGDQQGIKRKNRSETPEDRKKMRIDSPGFLSVLSSPLTSFKNRFRSDLPSSTPKLTGYKDTNNGVAYADDQIEIESGLADKKSWCSVM